MTDTRKTEDSKLVAKAAEAELGAKTEWVAPKGYPDSLALCILDSVFSLRARYRSAEDVVSRYLAHRSNEGGNARTDGASDLIAAIDRVGGAKFAATELFNNRSVAPGTSTPKAIAVREGAEGLRIANVDTTLQLRVAESATLKMAKRNWLAVSGLGPASWHYVSMLSGRDGVKADTWIIRFVSRVLGESGSVDPQRASDAVRGAANLLDVDQYALDHRIWRHESGRS